jgi:hypothetical protein
MSFWGKNTKKGRAKARKLKEKGKNGEKKQSKEKCNKGAIGVEKRHVQRDVFLSIPRRRKYGFQTKI